MNVSDPMGPEVAVVFILLGFMLRYSVTRFAAELRAWKARDK
jgi:hypothetical protein